MRTRRGTRIPLCSGCGGELRRGVDPETQVVSYVCIVCGRGQGEPATWARNAETDDD